MKLGIGLPLTLVPELNRGLFLDWCRTSDDAGFHVFGSIDQPAYDSWDPLVSLAAAAAVTERVRLATTILQLPNRNEITVAKQAAVIDRLSGGRLDLGVAVGSREVDYQVLGARSRFSKRGKRIETQIRKIRRTWRAAKRANADTGAVGPAPMQKPLPPIWLGGKSERAIARAVDLGDGYIFGAAGSDAMVERTPRIRLMAEEAGKKKFTIVGFAYCAVGDDLAAALERGAHYAQRYYGETPSREPDKLIHHGPVDGIAAAVKEYEQAGLDILILYPLIPEIKQVELIGEHVLPAYRVPVH